MRLLKRRGRLGRVDLLRLLDHTRGSAYRNGAFAGFGFPRLSELSTPIYVLVMRGLKSSYAAAGLIRIVDLAEAQRIGMAIELCWRP